MRIRSRSVTALALVVVLLLAACGDDGASTTTSSSAPTTVPPATAAPTTSPPASTAPPDGSAAAPQNYAEFREQPTACGSDAPPPLVEQTYPEPEDLGLDPATIIRARIETSCGEIVVDLDPSVAPETVNSFVFLARNGYFDGTASHRVLPGFVMQAGDQTATGRGNPGYSLPDELPPTDFVYTRGILAMANAGPDTGGSQFFIMLADAGLPPAYSVFGNLVEGDEVLDTISTLPLGDRSAGFNVETSVPLETLYIERVVIED